MKGIFWLWKQQRMRAYVRRSLYGACDVDADAIATRFGVDVIKVHEYCGSFKTMNGRHFQRLHNTVGIDYHPVGQYGLGLSRLPEADGATNPFLDRLDPAKEIKLNRGNK